MSPFDDAFIALLDENDAACGKPQFVMIGGKKKRAIVEENAANEVYVSGGVGESGGFRAQCWQGEFASEPKAGIPIQANGKGRKLQVISVIGRNGCTWEITAGDMSVQ